MIGVGFYTKREKRMEYIQLVTLMESDDYTEIYIWS